MAGPRPHPSSIGSGSPVFHFLLFCFTSPSCSAKIFQIDPKTVDLGTGEMWCAMEQQTWSLICNEPAQLDSKDNYCNAVSTVIASWSGTVLTKPETYRQPWNTYTCRCKTFEPPMERYEHTLPTFMCTKTYDDCVKNNLGDLAAQSNCTVTIKRFCGDLTPVPECVSGALEASSESEDKTSRDGDSPFKTAVPNTDTRITAAPTTTLASNGEKTLPSDPSKRPAQDAVSSSTYNSSGKEGDREEDSNPGGDTGAKVGIAVGTIGGVALLICIIYILRLRKKAALAAAESSTCSNTTRNLAEIENGRGLQVAPGASGDIPGQLHSDGKPELDGKALDGGKQWIVAGAVEMEAPGYVEGVPQAVHEMEVVSPVELDATGNTFELTGVVKKKSWIEYVSASHASSSNNLKEMSIGCERLEMGPTSRVSLLEGQGIGAVERRSSGNRML